MQNKNSPIQSENMLSEANEESKHIISQSLTHPEISAPIETSNSENIQVSSENKYDNTTKDPSFHEENKGNENDSPYLLKNSDSKGR